MKGNELEGCAEDAALALGDDAGCSRSLVLVKDEIEARSAAILADLNAKSAFEWNRRSARLRRWVARRRASIRRFLAKLRPRR